MSFPGQGSLDGSAQCVKHAEVPGPYLDIDVIAGLCVDWPEAENGDASTAMQREVIARYRALRGPLADGRRCGLLVTIGDPAIEGRAGVNGQTDGVDAGVWLDVLSELGAEAKVTSILAVADTPSFARAVDARFGADTDPEAPWPRVVLSVTGVCLKDDPEIPYAYVAVVGISAEADELAAQDVIRELATGVARNAPLYVIGVGSGVDRATAWDGGRWRNLRTSVVLYGPADRDDVLTLHRTPLDAGRARSEVAMVPCPPFRKGEGTPGMARLRIDVVKGLAEVALHYDLGSDLDAPPIQFVRPLVSASRVSSGERRLYARVRAVVGEAIEARRDDSERLRTFLSSVERHWDETGYTMLCTDDCELAGMAATRTLRYLLLLVLREREDGGYDLLLSNHSPLRESNLAEWNTLLLPAFQHPHTLLGHLRDDVMRQAVERAEDITRGAHAQAFDEAIGRILQQGETDDDVWVDQVRELATFTTRKISPTTGLVTEYDYHLVTLLPLIDRLAAREEAGDNAGSADEQDRRDAHKVIKWLEDLDTVRSHRSLQGTRRGLPIEALQHAGAGLRFDPEVDLVEHPAVRQRARSQKAPPGAVWFPLGEGEQTPWRTCPSIVARNADVMGQVEKAIASFSRHGPVPKELILGRYERRGGSGYEIVRTYAYDENGPDDDPDVPGLSTCDALRRVTFGRDSDLRGEPAYPDATFRRVYLVKQDVGARGRDRQAILVFDADTYLGRGTKLLPEEESLGRLRPVQRYVLQAGLDRAREIDETVLEQLRELGADWAFARVLKDGVGAPVSVTPPIVEYLHEDDWGSHGARDFVLCDGNHRIVERVWIDEKPMAAVVASPAQPYYAIPFGDLEWGVTAENVLLSTPSQESKYLARKVTEEDVEPEAWAKVSEIPKRRRYRRYFRDLETGFGSLGGQGGRFAG